VKTGLVWKLAWFVVAGVLGLGYVLFEEDWMRYVCLIVLMPAAIGIAAAPWRFSKRTDD
jgi:hypothetical protein